jgi:hypothetical protein
MLPFLAIFSYARLEVSFLWKKFSNKGYNKGFIELGAVPTIWSFSSKSADIDRSHTISWQ